MIYRERKHPAGSLPRCDGCDKEPMHVQANGRLSREPVRIGTPSERHMIECPRCGRRTKLRDSLALALAEWGAHHTQPASTLRVVKGRAA